MRKIIHWLDTYFLRYAAAFTLAFVALYPKLPTIYIHHTWVYVRLEDFVISVVALYYIFLLIRKKITFPFSVGASFVLYWIVGLISLIISLIFIGPYIPNFFSSVAILSYLRRIEYMILFFVGVAAIKNTKDLHFYFKAIIVTMIGVLLYGYGQKFYTLIWHWFPVVHKYFNFCFPSFQTGNEEFAKGIPLCLPFDSRMTSTFAGHYDLAGWLLLLIPIVFAVSFTYAWRKRLLLWLLGFLSILLMTFTASRSSFVAYFVSVGITLVLIKQKKAIIPVFIVSLLCFFTFNSSTINRFAQTFRTQSVVVNSEGEVVGLASNTLTAQQQKLVDEGKKVAVSAPPPSQNIPLGNSYISLPQTSKTLQKTNVAVVQSSLSVAKAKQLNFDYGGIQLSTVSGNFTVRKVLVADISFTTRLQGEWPNAWRAFLRDPFFGSGFATITLAADNDYLRNLGETGLLGILSFAFIFLVLYVLMHNSIKRIPDPMVRAFILGMAGGLLGLFADSVFYDMFEASKIAETVWLMLGLIGGTLLLVKREDFSLISAVKSIVTSNFFLMFYIFVGLLALLLPFMGNFFVADDFSWLHWSAAATLWDIPRYFVDAQGFFYRPFDRIVMIGLFSIFGFNPEGYHTFFLFVHFIIVLAVYALLRRVFGSKLWAYIGTVIFAFGAFHAENIFWISTLSITFSTLWMILGLMQFIRFRDKSSMVSYVVSLFLAGLSLITYEMAVVFPLLCLVADWFLVEKKKRRWGVYIPMILLDIVYLIVRQTSRVAPIAGDYSYNWLHFIPNAAGNKLGYVGLFLFGQNSLGLYTALREGMRQNHVVVGGLIVLFVALVLLIIVFWKRCLRFIMKIDRAFLFGIGFWVVAMLPFIGLGNITERYLYLGSVGLIIVFVSLSRWVIQKYPSRNLAIGMGILFTLFIVYHGFLLYTVGNQWKQAGIITENTLGFFKAKYPNLTAKDTVYINNLPIRKANAWIFPVGLSDGMWFIYDDQIPYLRIAQSGMTFTKDKTHRYVFTFADNGVIEEQQ